MQRDYTTLDRCRDCGSVLRMLVHEQGLDEEGNPYQAIYADTVPHTRNHCAVMQRLAREEWPTLW